MSIFPPPPTLTHPLLRPGVAAGAADELARLDLREQLDACSARLGHLVSARQNRAEDQTALEGAMLDRLIAKARARREALTAQLHGVRGGW